MRIDTKYLKETIRENHKNHLHTLIDLNPLTQTQIENLVKDLSLDFRHCNFEHFLNNSCDVIKFYVRPDVIEFNTLDDIRAWHEDEEKVYKITDFLPYYLIQKEVYKLLDLEL